MAAHRAEQKKVTAPELEQFLCLNVQLTGVVLGAGAYGSVEEVKIPGARVAAKKLHRQLINLGSPQQVHKWVTDFVEECKLMSQLHHPHIVQFMGVCYLPGSSLPALLMEKLQTSLDSLLETSPNIPLDIKVYLLIGTGQGVVYLHSHTPPIAHRDLTARNILIDSGMNAKIADLGVAKMVNIQPGQLAATMTNAPGNNLYMPPEAVQEEGATRYNTAIDIFSFGVVSLFTLTQTFPKDLKPASFFDPVTRRVLGRTEIERRDEYVKLMTVALGQTHQLVKLTLDCLEFLPEDRPPAQVVLRQLEEVETTMPQNCTESKLELIQQKDDLATRKEEEIRLIQIENQKQLSEKNALLHQLQVEVHEKQERVEQFQLQATEKQNQICRLEQLTNHQQQELEAQQGVIEQLLTRQESLQFQLRSYENQELSNPLQEQRQTTPVKTTPVFSTPMKTTPATATPVDTPVNKKQHNLILTMKDQTSIAYDWSKCTEIEKGVTLHGQPVTLNGKLYIRGVDSEWAWNVYEYTPRHNQWAKLPPPLVNDFTIATLKDQLLVVGGFECEGCVVGRTSNIILSFNQSSQEWIKCYLAMPTRSTFPAVLAYEDYLIVTSGRNETALLCGVNILDTSCSKWFAAEKLPIGIGMCSSVLIEDVMYLVGQDSRVLRTHVPSLISGTKSGVWERLSDTPYCRSSVVTIGNTLLTVGGRKNRFSSISTLSIQQYDPINDQWTRVGDFPESMKNCLVVLQSESCDVEHYLAVHNYNISY